MMKRNIFFFGGLKSFGSLGFILIFILPGCDSNNNNDDDDDGLKTEFVVKYQVTGSCDNILSVGYTITGGGTKGENVVLPWSFETDFSAPTPFTAVALAVNCLGGGAVNSLEAKIFVDGTERDAQSATGDGLIGVTAGTLLN